MSEKINDGGQAFPVPDGTGGVWHGMTLRDYFAAKSLPFVAGRADLDNTGAVEWANACYEIADAMLAAREVQP